MKNAILWKQLVTFLTLARYGIGSASIDFKNKTSVVAVEAVDLHYETINPVGTGAAFIQWSLNINGTQTAIFLADYNFLTNNVTSSDPNTNYSQAASCGSYNDTHFVSLVIVGPIPFNTSKISFESYSDPPTDVIIYIENLTSTYCPLLNDTGYLVVSDAQDAVYNQQARFNCSKGELYDGLSINPDYYRTCQFDATWSGEMPQCWIEPVANISSSSELVSQQEVSFSCHVIDGYPDLFEASLRLGTQSTTKSNMNISDTITLSTTLTSEMNQEEIVCKVNNSYKETTEKKKLNVLFGPINQANIIYGTLEYGKQVIVYLNFTANPRITKNTTNLTCVQIDTNTTFVDLTDYQIINSSSDFQQYFEWVIYNFTEAHEGNYTFAAWSHIDGVVENITEPFELKVGLSSIPATTAPETTVPPTSTGGSTSKSVTTSKGGIIGNLSLGLLIGIAAGGLAIIVAIIVVVILIIRRRKKPAGDTVLMNGEDLGNGRVDRTNVLYDSNEFVEKEERTNPIYEAGGGGTSSGGGDVYAQVNKRGKKNQGGDVYAQVNKPRKNNTDTGGDVYAQVNKNGKKGVNNDAYQQDPPAYAAAHNNE